MSKSGLICAVLLLLGLQPAWAEDAFTTQLYGGNDDLRERLGEKPTYVLVEKDTSGKWVALAVGKTPPTITNETQERLLVSNDFKNIAPEFTDFRMRYQEDPRTGVRSAYVFRCSSANYAKTKNEEYSPCNSWLTPKIGTGAYRMPNSEIVMDHGINSKKLTQIVEEAEVIASAKAFWAGTWVDKTPSTVEQQNTASRKLEVNQTWLVRPQNGSDGARFLFQPQEFLKPDLSLVSRYAVVKPADLKRDISADYRFGLLETSFGLFSPSNKLMSWEGIKRFKVIERGYQTQKAAPNENHKCDKWFVEDSSGARKEYTTCGEWQRLFGVKFFYAAKDDDKEFARIDTIRGMSKRLYSNDAWEPYELRLSEKSVDEIVVLSEEELARYSTARQ